MTERFNPDQPEQEAEVSPSEMAAFLSGSLGDALTALMVLGDPSLKPGEQDIDPEDVGRWASGDQAPSSQNIQKIKAAYGFVQEFVKLDELSVAGHWFVGMNPVLGDRSPAEVFMEDPGAIEEALRDYIANG